MSQFKGSPLIYRPEIDGLRGLAVLLVLLFHLEFDAFSSGLIGVDVFFVISGYLITHSIRKEYSRGYFTLLSFFHRRVLRILPGLFGVILFMGLGAVFVWDHPRIYAEFPAMLYSILFVSNIYFAKQTTYSSFESGLSPFFHTWSLAVEEQFYLFWPFFLLLFLKTGKKWFQVIAILGLCLLSFSLRQFFIDEHPLFSFHSMPTRVWEMAIGGALVYLPKDIIKGKVASMVHFFGLLMILYSSIGLDMNTRTHGTLAVVPVVGSLFYLMTPGVSRTPLKLKPIVLTGKMSYSLYLIHWPMIVFYKETVDMNISLISKFLILIASIGLAYLSWRVIEQPFLKLRSKNQVKQIKIIGFGLAAIVGLSLATLSSRLF